jgi:hypothetical protein
MTSLVRRAIAVVAALVATVSVTGVGVPFAGAAAPSVQVTAFGMHWLNTGHPYPGLTFGSARIWDMGVTWADLQPDPPPTPSLPVVGSTTPAPWNQTALAHLDSIVNTFVSHHVQPMLTLGVTPAWAAHPCNHVRGSTDYGIGTCAPQDTSVAGPWGQYVDYLANRYKGKLKYFEVWNEASLGNGYNDSIQALAQMQQTAHTILARYSGDQLISPGIPFTNGSPTNGYNWLRSFLSQSGGTAFDIVGLHLYPADGAARGGYGPEWSINTGLAYAKKALAAYHVQNRPIWNTEYNVGRQYAHTGYKESSAGAAAVVRSYVLAVENHIARTFWYGADDRTWGGTWLEKSNYRSLTAAGLAYKTVERLVVGKAVFGCTAPRGTSKGMYQCRLGTNSGRRTMLVVWTDSRSTRWHLPKRTSGYYTATGAHHGARGGQSFTVTSTPVFLTGTF